MTSRIEKQDDESSASLCGFPVPVDEGLAHGQEMLDVLMTRFKEARRVNPSTSIEDYVKQYPHLADEIREIFPLIVELDEWKNDKEVECLRSNLGPDLNVRKIGRYDIRNEIGRGGMGVVLEAIDSSNNQRVAVKLLPWRYGTSLSRWRQRFQKEAETVSRMSHRNIVPIQAFGEHDGYCYYVMKLVEGPSLEEIILRLSESDSVAVDEIWRRNETAGPQGSSTESGHSKYPFQLRSDSWRLFAIIGTRITEALHYAHSQGVLHNDIKPANILLDRRGGVLVTDFGLASPIEEESGELSSRLSGTVRYMGPERFSGLCDVRSDIFSFGATLYELLTHTSAFEAVARKELIKRIQQASPRRPRKINAEIPRDLERIVMTCLAKDPACRYQTAHALLADLLRFINGERIRAKKTVRFRTFARWLWG